MDTQCCDIREAATSEVDVLTIVLLGLGSHIGAQILGDSSFLIPRSLEVVAEAARRAGPSCLGRKANSAADCGDVRAGCRENRVELRCLAILVQACSSNTCVSGRLKNRDATHTEDADQVANTLCVLLRHCLLVVSVGVGDHLRQCVIGLGEQVLVIRQVRLVLVGCTSRLDRVRDVWAAETGVR